MNKAIKTSLPVTSEFLRRKRLVQERGELALIEDGITIRHLGYFSLIPGKEHFRGGHYHTMKTEHFYVIGGRLRVLLADVESDDTIDLELVGGDTLVISPMCAHLFSALEHSQVIEYYETAYDPADDHRHQFKG
jgi:dTDP-4-dehydrorhamnose 3,5-epimerase-like enzyme